MCYQMSVFMLNDTTPNINSIGDNVQLNIIVIVNLMQYSYTQQFWYYESVSVHFIHNNAHSAIIC